LVELSEVAELRWDRALELIEVECPERVTGQNETTQPRGQNQIQKRTWVFRRKDIVTMMS